MTSRAALLAIVVGSFAGACSKPYSNGYAVDLVISGTGSVDEKALQTGTTLTIDVSGAETASHAYTLSSGFKGGEERIIYRPLATSGELDFVATLTDANSALVGSGSGKATLKPGKTVTLHLDLAKPSAPDLGGTNVGFFVDKPTSDFGTFAVGQSAPTTVFLVTNASTHTSGAITISGATGDMSADGFSVTADDCSGKMLPPDTTCTFAVALDTSMLGLPMATLIIDGGAAGTASSVLSANIIASGTLTLSPLVGDFGSAVAGQASMPITFQVTNAGGVTTGALAVSYAGGDMTMFSAPSGCSGMALAMGQSCMVTARFMPPSGATVGGKSTSLLIVGMPGGTIAASLRGSVIAAGALGIAPGSFDFGKVSTGTSSPTSSFVVTNTGTSTTPALTTTPGGDSGEFSIATDGCNGKTLAGGATCTIDVAFSPTKTQSSILTLTIGDGASSVVGTAAGEGGSFVTLTVARTGAGTLIAPGVSCGSDCTEVYTVGTMVTLTAAPDITAKFGAWTGTPCAGSNLAVCPITMSADTTVSATFTARPAQNLAFVTSTTVMPATLGAAGADPQAAADAQCSARAVQGGLSGTFKAYLATSSKSAIAHLGSASGWLRTDGLAFALSQASLVAGQILYPLRIDETGTAVADDPAETTGTATVATGTDKTGASLAAAQTCTDWTASTGTHGYGIATGGTDAWNARATSHSCATAVHLYCMETTYATGATLMPPTVFRHAFLTEGVTSPPFSGIAVGDNLCNSQKTMYNTGGGTYLAMLAPTGATAASRFNVAAGSAPWARPDGVLLASTAAALFTNSLLAAPNVTAASNYVGFMTDDPRLSIGSASGITGTATDAENCGNWMGNSGDQTVYGGRVVWSDQRWSNEVSQFSGCIGGNTVHILCLEQ